MFVRVFRQHPDIDKVGTTPAGLEADMFNSPPNLVRLRIASSLQPRKVVCFFLHITQHRLTTSSHGPHPLLKQVLGRSHASVERPFYVLESGTLQAVLTFGSADRRRAGSTSLTSHIEGRSGVPLLFQWLRHVCSTTCS